jgi:hypothetical protein
MIRKFKRQKTLNSAKMMGRHFLSEILAFKLKMQFITSMKREEEDKTKGKEAGVS